MEHISCLYLKVLDFVMMTTACPLLTPSLSHPQQVTAMRNSSPEMKQMNEQSSVLCRRLEHALALVFFHLQLIQDDMKSMVFANG